MSNQYRNALGIIEHYLKQSTDYGKSEVSDAVHTLRNHLDDTEKRLKAIESLVARPGADNEEFEDMPF